MIFDNSHKKIKLASRVCVQYDRQREFNIRTLHFPLSVEFFQAFHVEFRPQHRVFALNSEEIKILKNNNAFPPLEFEPTNVVSRSRHCTPAPRWPE